jgi:spermidine synthase
MAVDCVTLAHESATAEAFEVGVLEQLAREVGCDAAFLLVKGNEQGLCTLGFDAALRDVLLRRVATYGAELMPVKRAALAARGVAVDTEVFDVEHIEKTRYYRDIVRNVRGRHSLLAYVPWRGRIVAAMMLGRCGRGFSLGERSLVEGLLPTLGVTRAAYGLSPVFDPLPRRAKGHVFKQVASGQDPRVLGRVRVDAGTVSVRDRGDFREMVMSDGASELVWTRVALDDSTRSGWPYVDLLHLAPALAKQRQRVLFVGSGGAVSARQFARVYPGIEIDVVEREPAVVELGRAWFDIGSIPGLNVHIADGAAFIRGSAQASWDVIVIDAFDASTFCPAFADRSFLVALRSALRPGGAVACNVIGTLAGDGPVRSFVAAIGAVFDTVRIVPVVALEELYLAGSLRNVVVIAT